MSKILLFSSVSISLFSFLTREGQNKIQTFLSENSLNKGVTKESLDLWKNLNFWIFPQCLRLQNPSHSFFLFYKQILYWLRIALHIIIYRAIPIFFPSTWNVFCKTYFMELIPAFLAKSAFLPIIADCFSFERQLNTSS